MLSPVAVDWHRVTLAAVVGPDVGLGEKDLRKEVTAILARPILDPSPERRRLWELIERARPGYVRRTAAPLVGAGLDRMAYGRFTEGIEPLDLAARAKVALQLVAGETGLQVVDLLQPTRRQTA